MLLHNLRRPGQGSGPTAAIHSWAISIFSAFAADARHGALAVAAVAAAEPTITATTAVCKSETFQGGCRLFSLGSREAEANPSLHSDVKRETRRGAPSSSVKHTGGSENKGPVQKGHASLI
jgi:hypothetical protein